MNRLFIFLSFLLSFYLLTHCDNDVVDPPPSNDGEVITTLSIQLRDSIGALSHFIFRDPDGVAGSPPIQIDTIRLKSNNIYSCSIGLLNETKNPIDTLTNEIISEADEHIFCFNTSTSNLEIERTDSDGIYEIGLESSWSTKSKDQGTLKVTLKHQVNTKDGTCDPGETDIEIDFPLVID